MYYKVANSADPSIVGSSYPQISVMKKGYDYNKPNSTRNFSNNNLVPDLDGFRMEKGSILTNVISEGRFNGRAILCDLNTFKFFSEISISNHKVFDAIIYSYDGLNKYSARIIYFPFHDVGIRSDIDMEASEFHISNFENSSDGDIDSSNLTLEDLRKISIQDVDAKVRIDSGQMIGASKLSIRQESSFDIFDIPILGLLGRYCNEKTKDKIEAAGITGLTFEEAPWIRLD